MKKTVFALVALCLLFGAGDALAQCHTVSGPWSLGARQWYDYIIPRSCYTTSNVTNANGSCFGGDAWSFGASSSVSYQFTVGSPVLAQWLASTRVTFTDNNNSAANWIQLRVTVNSTTYIIFTWDGTMGDLNGCALSSGNFPATTGDSVTVTILADAGSGTPYIEALIPAVTNYNF